MNPPTYYIVERYRRQWWIVDPNGVAAYPNPASAPPECSYGSELSARLAIERMALKGGISTDNLEVRTRDFFTPNRNPYFSHDPASSDSI
jgi:hypothetical protein